MSTKYHRRKNHATPRTTDTSGNRPVRAPSQAFTPQTARHANPAPKAPQNPAQRIESASNRVVRQFQIAHRARKNAEQPPETPANPPGAPPRKRAPHTVRKQNAGAPGGAPQQNPTPPKKAEGVEKGSRRDLHPDPYHQSNVHTQQCGGKRASANAARS